MLREIHARPNSAMLIRPFGAISIASGAKVSKRRLSKTGIVRDVSKDGFADVFSRHSALLIGGKYREIDGHHITGSFSRYRLTVGNGRVDSHRRGRGGTVFVYLFVSGPNKRYAPRRVPFVVDEQLKLPAVFALVPDLANYKDRALRELKLGIVRYRLSAGFNPQISRSPRVPKAEYRPIFVSARLSAAEIPGRC